MASEETTNTIAKALAEADAGPLAQIKAVVDFLGDETCLGLLAETERIEKAGGMERGDGKGRRSAGGVFFYLARQKLPKEQRAAIFNDKMPREPRPPGSEPSAPRKPKEAERPNFPRRRVFEVTPPRPTGSRPSGPFAGPPSSQRSGWTPPSTPPGTFVPPELPNAVARGRAKLGILDALGSLHPDDQYLVLLELLGDLHAVYGATAEHAVPESKSAPRAPESSRASAPPPPVIPVAAAVNAEPPAPVEETPPPPPVAKRKAPAKKSAKSS